MGEIKGIAYFSGYPGEGDIWSVHHQGRRIFLMDAKGLEKAVNFMLKGAGHDTTLSINERTVKEINARK